MMISKRMKHLSVLNNEVQFLLETIYFILTMDGHGSTSKYNSTFIVTCNFENVRLAIRFPSYFISSLPD